MSSFARDLRNLVTSVDEPSFIVGLGYGSMSTILIVLWVWLCVKYGTDKKKAPPDNKKKR